MDSDPGGRSAHAAARILGTTVGETKRASRSFDRCVRRVWVLSLGLFAVPLISYTSTAPEVWVAVYGSILCFLAGAYVATRFSSRLEGEAPPRERLIALRVHLAWLITGALALLGFGLFVGAIDSTVGWKALVDDPALARLVQGSPEFEEAYGVGRVLSYFSGVSLLLSDCGPP